MKAEKGEFEKWAKIFTSEDANSSVAREEGRFLSLLYPISQNYL